MTVIDSMFDRKPVLYVCVVLVVLFCAGVVRGQSVELPKEVSGDPGTILVVKAKTDCPSLKWVALDPGLSVIPPELLRDSKSAVVMAGRPGRYRLLAYGALKDQASEPATTVVVIGQPGPGPGPGPGPTPPVDPFTEALAAAYGKEAEPDKAARKASLAALYRQGSDLAARTDLATWGALFSVLRDAAGQLGLAGKLPGVQGVIQTELKRVLPAQASATLDAAGRTLAATTFRKVAAALEDVK